MKKQGWGKMGYAFLLLLFLSVFIWQRSPHIQVVSRVIDGSMVELQDGEIVRYIGVDEEGMHPDIVAVHRQLVEGRRGELEFDVRERDKEGRLWAYLSVNGLMVNEWLVANGYARASFFPPNLRYAERIRHMEEEARKLRIGIWERDT